MNISCGFSIFLRNLEKVVKRTIMFFLDRNCCYIGSHLASSLTPVYQKKKYSIHMKQTSLFKLICSQRASPVFNYDAKTMKHIYGKRLAFKQQNLQFEICDCFLSQFAPSQNPSISQMQKCFSKICLKLKGLSFLSWYVC